jgi:hypothetical protein
MAGAYPWRRWRFRRRRGGGGGVGWSGARREEDGRRRGWIYIAEAGAGGGTLWRQNPRLNRDGLGLDGLVRTFWAMGLRLSS